MIYFYNTPEDFAVNKLYCNSWVATAVVGAAAVGGAAKIFAANTAADAQKAGYGAAAQTAKEAALHAQNALEFYNGQAQNYLQPYQQLGQTGIDQLNSRLPGFTTPVTSSDAQKNLAGPLPVSQQQLDLRGALPVSQEQRDLAGPLGISQEQMDLRKPITIDQATLETLPGYQFARTQGLKAVQNSAAARGLGVSGAALKGAATFSQGLADQNYSTYFQQQMQNNQAAFERYAATYGQAAAERAAAAGRFGQIFNQETGERQAASSREAQIFGQQASERQASTGREQQLFQNQVTGQQTAYDRLMGIIGAGEGAAATGGTLAQKTGQGVGTALTAAGGLAASANANIGNAEAAGINAIGGAVSDAANSIGGYAAYKGITNQGLYGSSPNMSYIKGTAGDQFVPTFGK